uniref:Uncharacterized protein n=1 Tax=Arundo donax TaxID=35708 RepID=A0A0A9FLT9_ARUDO
MGHGDSNEPQKIGNNLLLTLHHAANESAINWMDCRTERTIRPSKQGLPYQQGEGRQF